MTLVKPEVGTLTMFSMTTTTMMMMMMMMMIIMMIIMMIVCTGSGENINPGLPWYGVHQSGASKNGS